MSIEDVAHTYILLLRPPRDVCCAKTHGNFILSRPNRRKDGRMPVGVAHFVDEPLESGAVQEEGTAISKKSKTRHLTFVFIASAGQGVALAP